MLAEELRRYLALGQEFLAIVEQENSLLRNSQAFDFPRFAQKRQRLLPRIAELTTKLRASSSAWQSLPPSARRRQAEIAALLRQNQDLLMRLLLLDRENEQAMLRRGLVPVPAPAPARSYLADLYRRGSTPA